MQITIKSIHITEYQQATWGRVYIQYEQDNQELFIYKNWIQFAEKTYKDVGSLTTDTSEILDDGRSKHVYFWFEANKRHVYNNYQDVLDGKADGLYLTSEKYRKEYGTPSIILKRLLIELRANSGEPAENRKGWFQRFHKPDLVLSNLMVDVKYKITLPLYDVEIKLEPLLKLVYCLFLNHLKGIALKEISNHTNELRSIYQSISPNTEKDIINKRIDELLNITNDSLHQKISKINKIFKDELGDNIALPYQILGSAGQPYKINLEVDLIKKLV